MENTMINEVVEGSEMVIEETTKSCKAKKYGIVGGCVLLVATAGALGYKYLKDKKAKKMLDDDVFESEAADVETNVEEVED